MFAEVVNIIRTERSCVKGREQLDCQLNTKKVEVRRLKHMRERCDLLVLYHYASKQVLCEEESERYVVKRGKKG